MSNLLMDGMEGAHALLRWRLRGLLALLPAHAASGKKVSRIAYLFAGTYGDFVQALPALRRLASAYPAAEIILSGAARYAREFAPELPTSVRAPGPFEPWLWIFRPADLLLTNAVGVYRVRFDFTARFCARRAYGFRHAHESRRGGYSATVKLDSAVRSFADENQKALDLAGVPASMDSAATTARATSEIIPSWGKGQILFHIGSAGLKRDFGLKDYARLVLGILGKLKGRQVEIVMGPGDEDIALEVRSGSGLVPQMFPMFKLIRMLRSFEGTVLCFNSFQAHLCRYLDKPAIVIHRQAIPYGYDCSPMHRQVVLKAENAWDLGGVWDALGLKRGG